MQAMVKSWRQKWKGRKKRQASLTPVGAALTKRWQLLKDETTAHGISHLNKAKAGPVKVFWSLVLLSALCGLGYHTYTVVSDYLSRDVTVDTQIVTNTRLEFPAVTVCNANPVKVSAMLDAIDNGYKSLEDIIPKVHTFDDTDSDDDFTEAMIEQEDRISYVLAGLPNDVQRSIGYQKEDMFHSCEFDGYICDINNNFSQFYDIHHGNCFTFNSDWSLYPAAFTSNTGRRHGLKLILNVKQTENLLGAIDAAGVVVQVHPRDLMPFPEDTAVLMKPGQYTLLGLVKRSMVRKSRPYGDCILDDMEYVGENLYMDLYDVSYSKKSCLKSCHQKRAIEKCQCALPTYPRPQTLNSSSYCNTYTPSKELENCMEDSKKVLSLDNNTCECHDRCRDDSYVSAMSVGDWPTAADERPITDEMMRRFPETFEDLAPNDVTGQISTLKANFLKLDVYYEDLNVEMLTEIPIYTDPKFYCDIGSVLGLWMGISIVTIVEFVEFIIQMCAIAANCCQPRVHPQKRAARSYSTDNNVQEIHM